MTREEALKIVRENYPHFGTTEPWLDLEKALATLIPELAESEDERIRKHLIAIVELYWGKTNDPDKAKELAYLEKQKELNLIMANSPQLKEQKPLPPFDEVSPEEKMNHPLYLEGFDMGREVQKVFDKPSWKPSEEQMEALLNTLHPDDPYYHDLKSLYEQLKKL